MLSPNIDGVFNTYAFTNDTSIESGEVNPNCFGVFAGSVITVDSKRVATANNGNYMETNLVFNDNSDNATYQNSAALQVPATLCMVAIRF